MSGAFETDELRWFFDGPCPTEITSWYCKLCDISVKEKVPQRSDIYLVMDERDDLGIKLRNGKLQLKVRENRTAFSLPKAKTSGFREHWSRYSWTLSGSSPEALASVFAKSKKGQGRRITLEKWRRHSGFSFDGRGQIKLLTNLKREAGFLSLELVEIRQKSRPFWGVCLETAPQSGTTKGFELAVAKILADYPGPPLIADHALGYPAFLATRANALS